MKQYRVLITGPAWIGDMVMAQSLFIWLRQSNPDISIDVLAPPWTLPVVERMPEVSRAIELKSRHGKLDLMMRIKTGRLLKSANYDEAIIIPKTFKAALPTIVAGIKKRTGFRSHFGLINHVRTFSKSRKELFVRRYLALVADDAYTIERSVIPEPHLLTDATRTDELLAEYSLTPEKFVILAPGAEFGPAKQWPLKHFSRLASLLVKKGLQVVIMGAAKEQLLSTAILDLSPSVNILDLCGKTSLAEAIDLMSAAHCVVANDSGLMHLAYASGVKVVAIYGSSSPLYTPPLSHSGEILQHSVPCQPCFERTCRFGHYECLTGVQPEFVGKLITHE